MAKRSQKPPQSNVPGRKAGPKARRPAVQRARVRIPRYFLVRTQSGRENWARLNIERQGHVTFWPRIEITDKGKLAPLFPGYLFVMMDEGGVGYLRGTFGVVGLVPTDKRVEFVPRKVMAALMAAVNEEGYIELPPPPVYRPLVGGERVIVQQGAFISHPATYIALTPDDRCLVLLSMFGKDVETTYARAELMELERDTSAEAKAPPVR